MRQFDVYEAPSRASLRIAPFVAVIQSHFLKGIPTVIIAPLVRSGERLAYHDVGGPLSFADEDLVLSLVELVTVDRTALRRRRGTVRQHDDSIRRAPERVFTGF